MTTTWEQTKTRHGTHSGWQKHQELGERPCDACYAAKQAYDRERLTATDKQKANRARAWAQNHAKTELVRRHRAEYLTLYREFKDERGVK